MISRRGLLAGAGAVAGAQTLAACGSGAPGQTADQAGPGADGRAMVQFWKGQLTDREDQWYDDCVEQFNAAQSDHQVVVSHVPGDAWEQRLRTAQAAGTAPDMYLAPGNNVAVAVSNGELADLSDLVPQSAWDDLDETGRQLVSVDGAFYAYPMLYEPQTVLYWRKDWFSEAGLDPETPPASWEELLDAGRRVGAQGRFGFLMGVTQGDFGWQSWGWQRDVAGHLPISEDWTTAQADDPAYEQLAAFLRDLYADGVIPQQSLGGANDSLPFVQGRGAMMMQGSWGISQVLDEAPELRDVVGVAPLPSHDGSNVVPVTIGTMKWQVDARSQNPDGAAAFITWALGGGDDGPLLDYFRVTGFSKFPTRTSMSEQVADQPDADEVNPWRAIIADEVMPSAELEPRYDWQVAEAFGIALEKAMRGEDIPTALGEANTRIEELIESLDLPSKV